jgi:hypothetical protein
MATRNPNEVQRPHQSAKRSKRGPAPTVANRRASQRQAEMVVIDLASVHLRRLMVEQCAYNDGHLTAYRASRGVFLGAGVPEAAFPPKGREIHSFRIMDPSLRGTYDLGIEASMQARGDSLELEVYWGSILPGTTAGHPALCELARTLLIEMQHMCGCARNDDTGEVFRRLYSNPIAVDFKQSTSAHRFKMTPSFQEGLRRKAMALFEFVRDCGEVITVDEKGLTQPTGRPELRLVEVRPEGLRQP